MKVLAAQELRRIPGNGYILQIVTWLDSHQSMGIPSVAPENKLKDSQLLTLKHRIIPILTVNRNNLFDITWHRGRNFDKAESHQAYRKPALLRNNSQVIAHTLRLGTWKTIIRLKYSKIQLTGRERCKRRTENGGKMTTYHKTNDKNEVSWPACVYDPCLWCDWVRFHWFYVPLCVIPLLINTRFFKLKKV